MQSTAPRSKGTLKWVAVAVIALIVFVVVLLYAYGQFTASTGPGGTNNPNTVNVVADDWQFSSCWKTYASDQGLSVKGGSTYTDSLTLSVNSGLFASSCTVETVAIQTAGFSIVNVNTPLTIEPGGSGVISITIQAPNSDWTGTVNLYATVS